MSKAYQPGTILSSNTKTGCSINLPIKCHCRPTATCAKTCYARKGKTIMPHCLKKQKWVSKYLEGSDISQLIRECKAHTSVRLSGTGDILESHVPNLLQLAAVCKATQFWGMTRKLEIASALNGRLPNLKLMVSIDNSSPQSVRDYQGAKCWGPRLAEDVVPNDPNIITVFPYHNSGKIVQVKKMPTDHRDCPAVRHTVSGCLECGKCWSW